MAARNPAQRATAYLSGSPMTHQKLSMRNEIIFNCKLYDCDLVGCTIDSCELYTCTIRDAKTCYSKIHDSQVSHSKISDAELYRCHKIEGWEVLDSILVDSVLLRSTFTDDPSSSHLRSLFFRNCRMANCRVRGGRMCRSSFNKGWLRNCKAETTKITGSHVQDSNLLYCEFKTGRVQDTIFREGSLRDSCIIGPEGCREVARAPLAFERFPLEIVQAIFQEAISWDGKRVALIDAVHGHKVFYEEVLKALSSVGVFCVSTRNISCPPFRAGINDNITRMNWSRVKNLALEYRDVHGLWPIFEPDLMTRLRTLPLQTLQFSCSPECSTDWFIRCCLRDRTYSALFQNREHTTLQRFTICSTWDDRPGKNDRSKIDAAVENINTGLGQAANVNEVVDEGTTRCSWTWLASRGGYLNWRS